MCVRVLEVEPLVKSLGSVGGALHSIDKEARIVLCVQIFNIQVHTDGQDPAAFMCSLPKCASD